jgi:hypothetical protein
MLRSVLAIVAGVVALSVTSFALDAVFRPAPASPLSLVYTTLCIVGAGYVTAWVAARAALAHAAIYGALQVALTLWAFFAVGGGSRWVWIAGMILVIPAAMCGGAIRARQTRRQRQTVSV